jgi:outer membrane protein TolC
MQYRISNQVFAAALLVILPVEFRGARSVAQELPSVALPSSPCPSADSILHGPVLSDGQPVARFPPAAPDPTDRPLPINLATAVRLSGGRPVIIVAAQASVQLASAELEKARALWLPSFNVGVGYYRHDGSTQGQSGSFYINSKDQFFAGAGVTARVDTADAIFAPLAARQVLRSREIDVQTARNDALLATAEAYFNVQQARGVLAGTIDVVNKGLELRHAIDAQRTLASRPTDQHRARALLAEFDEAIASAREQWTSASADLTQVLRLDPAAVVIPLEPPNLRVTFISPDAPVDTLIPIGLTNRPELASQQALVQAALVRIRQERIRPLVPSLILEGSPGPAGVGGNLEAGVFASGAHGAGNPTSERDDVSAGLVWQLQNFGFGNRALVRERRAEQQQFLAELFRIQDRVAAEVARAHGQLRSAASRVNTAELGVEEARLAYEGSLGELGKIVHEGNLDILVRRTFEVIDALRSLSRAYNAYFLAVGDYNRAQFRLNRALGYAAGILVCEQTPGQVLAVDVSRPPQMAPVCAPDPCTCPKTPEGFPGNAPAGPGCRQP